MRRNAFLQLTGLTVDNHKNMVRRGVLPILEIEGGDADRGWGSYTLHQAVLTLLALELASAGLDQNTASTLVIDAPVQHWYSVASDESFSDIWLAALTFRYADERGAIVERTTPIVAPLAGVPGTNTKFNCTVEQLEKQSSSIILVNVSRAMRTIAARAVANKINIDVEGLWNPAKPTEPDQMQDGE